ncbi:MAG: 2Fe-2S iron-sulfur cluster binding domain-containing protein [Magnetococcales bacterium]|nr:2Fe-2S iron-sulfur cluster binding domain-containing protein [Magnetococcales bacterium]MBF0438722.1 2Fe-2S iron-sulfur cluster binding domain-containing protein [Magnetococcales bacterium]
MSQRSGWEEWREFRVLRKTFEDVSQSICSLFLEPVDGLPVDSFEPGQYLTFQFDVLDPVTQEARNIIRCYSFSDRPGLDHYRVSIKRIGLASNHVHDAIREGARLLAKGPGGQFCLDSGDLPVVLIAGGIGITPMLSMLNTLAEKGFPREVWLFYGVRNSGEQVCKAYLEELAKSQPNFHLHILYSQPLPHDQLGKDFRKAGHVDFALVRHTVLTHSMQFYVCGPRAMMEAMVPALRNWGVPEAQIHFESFGPSSLGKSSSLEGSGGTISFSKSEKSVLWDEKAESLLEFAEANGIDAPSGCRSGMCGACQTEILAGEVDYFDEPDYDPDPGCCLLCISKPKGDLVLNV